jgi:hypothetical protein
MRACSPTAEYLVCTEEFRVQFPAGPFFLNGKIKMETSNNELEKKLTERLELASACEVIDAIENNKPFEEVKPLIDKYLIQTFKNAKNNGDYDRSVFDLIQMYREKYNCNNKNKIEGAQ